MIPGEWLLQIRTCLTGLLFLLLAVETGAWGTDSFMEQRQELEEKIDRLDK